MGDDDVGGVFPANVQMALDWRRRPLGLRTLAWGRLPLQLPLIVWALCASRDLRGNGRTPRVSAGS